MTEKVTNAASAWVDAIDIRSDGVKDVASYEMKETLKKDLRILWARKTGRKITDAEYNRYANAAKGIFGKLLAGLSDIWAEYISERDKTLKGSNIMLKNLSHNISNSAKKARNLASDGLVTIQQKLISEDTVQAYDEKDGNYLIDLKSFEEQLKSKPMEQLNGLAMKNYFIHLKSKGLLNKEVLEKKCGSSERLLQLSLLWGKKMENEVHTRDALKTNAGLSEKTAAFIRSTSVGGVESVVERIFRDSLVSSVKAFGLEEVLFDQKKDKWKTKEQLDRKLDELNYEDLLKEFNEEFKGKIITSQMVHEFFQKKSDESVKKIQELEKEQKKAITGLTVGSMLVSCEIPKNSLGDSLADKKVESLTPEDKEKLVEAIRGSTNSLTWAAKTLVDTSIGLNRHRWMLRIARGMEKPASAETVAKRHNNNIGKNSETQKIDLRKILKTANETEKNDDMMKEKEEQGIYKDTLNQIGYAHISIKEIHNNRITFEKVLSLLETRGLKGSELYMDLQSRFGLKEEQLKQYVMAKDDITEEQYSEQKRQGRKHDGFADDLYKEDVKQKKTTDFTVAGRWEKLQNSDYARLNDTDDIGTKLSRVSEGGKYVPLQKIGTDMCFVAKDGDEYSLSINGKIEKCSKDEVENTLEAYDFFYDMGLKSVAHSMQEFLMTVTSSNSTYPRFNTRKHGFPKEHKTFLLGIVNDIFDLWMGQKIIATSTDEVIPAFKTKLGEMDPRMGLRKKWILTEQGDFHIQGLQGFLKKDPLKSVF